MKDSLSQIFHHLSDRMNHTAPSPWRLRPCVLVTVSESRVFLENVPGKPITETRIVWYIFDTYQKSESRLITENLTENVKNVENFGIIFVILDHF